MKKLIMKAVAAVLVLTMAFSVSLQAVAEGGKTYVSDIIVATASSYAAAKKMITAAGYTPVGSNANENNSNAVCIGIKTTNKASEAITDIAIMNMNGGYRFEDYDNVLKEYKDTADALVNEIYTAVVEYRENVKAGKTNALLAQKLLNRFYDEDFGTENNKLGDIFASDSTTKEQISVIFMQATSLAVTSIETCLGLGCSDNWIERFVNAPTDAIYTTEDDDKARTIYKSFESFQEGMNQYVNILNASGLSSASGEIDTATWDAYFDSLDEDEQSIVANYANTYDYLKATAYKSGTLYDFFMQDLKEIDNSDIYPLARAMTDGQACTVPYASLLNAIQFASSSEDYIKGFIDAEQTDVKTVSVFDGVDRSIFQKDGIALTNETMRQATSTSDYSWYKGNLSKETETAFYSIMGVSAGIAAVGIAVAAIASTKVSAIVTAAYQSAFANAAFLETDIMVYQYQMGAIADEWALEVLDQGALQQARVAAIEKGSSSVWGAVSGAAKIVSAVAIAIVLITLVIYLVKEYKAYNQRKEYTDVPRIIVDQADLADGTRKYTYYYAVKDTKGNYGDLNAWCGNEWNVMYYTKDSAAGNPVLASAVMSQYKTASDDSYNLPVHGFGSDAAYNLNKFAKNTTGIYMFFKSDAEANLTATAVSYGTYALVGAGGIVLGAAAMFVINKFLIGKKKKKETEDKTEE